jgi:hypothetical protein
VENGAGALSCAITPHNAPVFPLPKSLATLEMQSRNGWLLIVGVLVSLSWLRKCAVDP